MLENYKCIVLANGEFPTNPIVLQLLKKASFVIACDGAIVPLMAHALSANIVIGDLDSISSEIADDYRNRIIQVSDQETNDLTKAVFYARQIGYDELLLLGTTGLREDHTLGNIALLMEYAPLFKKIEILSDYGRFTPITETTHFDSYPGQQVSLFSIYPHNPISVKGLRYPIENRRLYYWWEGTLNEALAYRFTVELSQDAKVLVYRKLDNEKQSNKKTVLTS